VLLLLLKRRGWTGCSLALAGCRRLLNGCRGLLNGSRLLEKRCCLLAAFRGSLCANLREFMVASTEFSIAVITMTQASARAGSCME
jgi:hypothetical protein